ncbi:MAG TPA: 2-dehydropantoate 2-reductase [Candidatus Dormibacteraeota bacterium]|jgi:2-dehydropantoate 2-reductase|nr:2-dehydropantoate 2-reductase [Candidatus Dormibacteraeota bacterium]
MRTLVVGAGATGGFFGGRLAAAGRDVTFLVRPARAAALRERNLRIVWQGEEEVIRARLVTAPELSGPYDLVLLGIKSSALEQAMADIAPAIGPETSIMPFLNGMAHLSTLTERFGPAVLGGVVKVLTALNEEGDVLRFAPLASLTVGDQQGGLPPRVERIRAELDGAGFDVAASPDIVGAMWHKWVFISTIGATTCLMRGTIGEVVAVPGGSALGPAIMAEASAVSAAAGHPMPERESKFTRSMATMENSPLASSAYRDVVAGRPAEVEQIFGDLVARARSLSVPTPLLDLATMQLRVHQRRAEGQVQAAG